MENARYTQGIQQHRKRPPNISKTTNVNLLSHVNVTYESPTAGCVLLCRTGGSTAPAAVRA